MELALLKTVLSLVAVLGLMAAVLWGMKKYTGLGAASSDALVDIEVLSRKPLQPKRTIYVVKVLNKVMVLGATEHGFQPLGEIDDKTVIGELESRQKAMNEASPRPHVSFKDRLRALESLNGFAQRPWNLPLLKGLHVGVVHRNTAVHDAHR